MKSDDIDAEVETKSTDTTGSSLYLKHCFHTNFTGISSSGFSNLAQIGTAFTPRETSRLAASIWPVTVTDACKSYLPVSDIQFNPTTNKNYAYIRGFKMAS